MVQSTPIPPACPTNGIVAASPEKMFKNEESCVLCARKLGFSSLLHINAAVRNKDGAHYVEGGGQVCALCATKHEV
jgi:hypothetical protein